MTRPLDENNLFFLAGTGPSKLLKNLSDIKAEHKAISKEIEALKIAQEAFVKDIIKDLSKLEEAESQLLEKVGGEEALN